MFANKTNFKTMRLKKLFLIFLYFFFLHCKGQINSEQNKPSSVKAQDATTKLNSLVELIGELDKLIKFNLYGDYSLKDIDAFSTRLSNAEQYILELDEIDRLFKEIGEKDPTEKDYILKQVYAKVIELSLVGRKNDYLDYLKIVSLSKDQLVNDKYNPLKTMAEYEDKINKWGIKSDKLIRDSRNLIKSYLEKDRQNIDALSLKAILLYYENKYDDALREITNLIEMKDSGKNSTVLSDKYIGYLQAWRSQIHLRSNRIIYCRKDLESLRIMSEPEKSIFWAEMVLNCIKDKELKNHDIRLIGVESPTNLKFYNWRKLTYVQSSGNEEFNMQESQIKLSVNPKELFEKMNLSWEILTNLEISPWLKAQAALTALPGKPYNDPYNFYLNITNVKKKKLIKRQVLFFQERFDKSYELLNTLRFTRKSWSALITSNPEVAFYRLNRIKTNLGLYYLSKNSQTFLNVFNFLKIENKRIDNTLLNSIEEEFKESVENEIKQDIDFLEKFDPDNIYFLITKAEVVANMEEPGAALKQLEELSLKIKAGSTINGVEVINFIELNKAYIYLRLGQFEYLKQSVQILEANPYFDKYVKDFKVFIKFKSDEKIYKTE